MVAFASLRRVATRFAIRKHLPLCHDPLVADVNEHLELADHLILVLQLLLQVFDLFAPLLLDFLVLCVRVGHLRAQLRSQFLLKRHGWLLVERGQRIHGCCFHSRGVTLDSRTRVVDVTREIVHGGILAVQDLEGFFDGDAWCLLAHFRSDKGVINTIFFKSLHSSNGLGIQFPRSWMLCRTFTRGVIVRQVFAINAASEDP